MATIFLLASSVLFLGALVLGWLAGDRADRKAVFAIFAALLGTSVAHALLDGLPALTTIALFDGILLAFLFRHAMTTRSHWPLWFTGVLIVIFAVDICAAIFQPSTSFRFDLLSGFWSVMAFASMVAGVLYDRWQGKSGNGNRFAPGSG